MIAGPTDDGQVGEIVEGSRMTREWNPRYCEPDSGSLLPAL